MVTEFAVVRPPSTADLRALVRPRLMALGLAVILLTFAVAGGGWDAATLLALTAGSALCMSGASAANQALEWRTDALMRRTAQRPVAAGRVTAAVAWAAAAVLTAVGLAVLVAFVNPLVAWVSAAGWLSYVAVYTPMKTRSGLATVVGAVPGAVPTLIGWAAAREELSAAAWCLFAVLFLWQLPHFLAIAWMYRIDYERAGLKMLPGAGADGGATARQVATYGIALIPASVMPSLVLGAGALYFTGALLLSSAYLYTGLRMGRELTPISARRLLKASVLYLPLLFGLLVIDLHVR
jgi:protoheme IX farnesyltransferase